MSQRGHPLAVRGAKRKAAMAFPKLLYLLVVLTLPFTGCLVAQERPKERPHDAGDVTRARPVYEVQEVTVLVMESHPEQLSITARGTTRTGGWKNPQLRPRGAAKAGIYEFDFVADPPEGLATQMISPIMAKLTLKKPTDLRAVRIFAETNDKTGK